MYKQLETLSTMINSSHEILQLGKIIRNLQLDLDKNKNDRKVLYVYGKLDIGILKEYLERYQDEVLTAITDAIIKEGIEQDIPGAESFKLLIEEQVLKDV
jgi:hypothetical protein